MHQQKITAFLGPLKDWVTAMWYQLGDQLNSYDRSIKLFQRASEGKEIREQLLKALGTWLSISTLEFRTLAAGNKWNNPALKAVFQWGLNVDVLTCSDEKLTLDFLIDLPSCLDHLLLNQPLARRNELLIRPSSPSKPMQLCHRKQQCFYCGQLDHFFQLGPANIFTKLDLKNAYNLIWSQEEDKRKMGFIGTPDHSEYCIMPYGTCHITAKP